MKKITLFLLSLIFLISSCKDKKFPEHSGYVNDFENVLTAEQEKSLSDLVSDYDKKTSNQICIVTIDSIKPFPDMRNYCMNLGNEWGVGQEDKDNGIIILFSSHLKEIFISTGTGAGQIMTDSICSSIIDSSMSPQFREGKFFEGIKNGTERIMTVWGK